MNTQLETNVRASLKWKLGILRNGVIVKETPFSERMITDAGIQNYVSGVAVYWLTNLSKNLLGNSVTPDPVRKDGGAITFSQSGNTITASAPFFVAGDVGALFKFGTGTAGSEVYITAFGSTTSVTVNISQTVGSTAGVIHYVNISALLSNISGLTWSKQATGNGSAVTNITAGNCEVTHTTINISSAFASNYTLTEIGTKHDTVNSDLFDRDLINPPVAVLIGDQAIVTIELKCNYSSIVPVAVANIATGYNSAGDLQIESLGMGNSFIATYAANGNINASGLDAYLEVPVNGMVMAVLKAAVTLATFDANNPASIGTSDNLTMAIQSYGTGNKYRDSYVKFSISQGNGTIYGACIGSSGSGGRMVTLKYTSSFVKAGTQTLDYTWRKSCDRILTN